jgi:hypothetical protein
MTLEEQNMNDTPDPLDSMVDKSIKHAENVLIGKPGAALMPCFVLESSTGDLALIATPWSSERDKEATAYALRETMRNAGVVRYSFISEAWMAVAPPGTEHKSRLADHEMPANRPDRVEIVIISASDKRAVKSALLRIVRGEAGTVVRLDRDNKEAKHIKGRFADLLNPDPEQS